MYEIEYEGTKLQTNVPDISNSKISTLLNKPTAAGTDGASATKSDGMANATKEQKALYDELVKRIAENGLSIQVMDYATWFESNDDSETYDDYLAKVKQQAASAFQAKK